MEATVRCIPTQTAVVDGQKLSTGSKPALCFRGKTYALGIINDQDEICTITLTLRDHDTAPLLRYGAEAEYPVGRFISHMTRIMANKPISDDALELMKQWPNTLEDFGMSPTAVEEKPLLSRPARISAIRKANCIPSLARENETTPQKVRKFLRSQGMNSPYCNETEIRKLMKNYNKE